MRIYQTKRITELIKQHCLNEIATTSTRKDFSSHYYYLVSVIRTAPLLDRRIKDRYAPINKLVLMGLISWDKCNDIIKDLLRLGVIECDNRYVVGNKSKGYRITEEYLSDKWKLVDITDIKLNEKLESKYKANRSDITKAGKGYQIANYWLSELQVNSRQAKTYIDKATLTKDAKDTYKGSVLMIQEKEFFCTVDSTARRMHNNISNFPTPLRKYLSVDGQKLYNVDIANSQPLFLGLLMMGRTGIDKSELDRYLQVCVDGQFYEKLAEFAGLSIDLNDYQTRKNFKQKIFQGCLFDRNRAKLSKWELIFQKAFPTIFNEVRLMKVKSYNAVAIALQKEEASFIFKAIDVIDREIGRGQAPLLSIHDSIVSTEKYIDMVCQVMENEFRIKYNVVPLLTPKKL